MMSKIIYVLDNNESTEYKYNICEDTIIYHFSINSSSRVEVNLVEDNVSLYYYFAFSGGSFSQSSYAAGQPFSVRCCLIGVFSAPAAAFTFALAATHCVFWFCGGFGIFYNIYSYILSSALRNCLCC